LLIRPSLAQRPDDLAVEVVDLHRNILAWDARSLRNGADSKLLRRLGATFERPSATVQPCRGGRQEGDGMLMKVVEGVSGSAECRRTGTGYRPASGASGQTGAGEAGRRSRRSRPTTRYCRPCSPTRIAGVVKADAYGLGAGRVAKSCTMPAAATSSSPISARALDLAAELHRPPPASMC
jgi:hypothetical protein